MVKSICGKDVGGQCHIAWGNASKSDCGELGVTQNRNREGSYNEERFTSLIRGWSDGVNIFGRVL
jgi:hypothetical protein